MGPPRHCSQTRRRNQLCAHTGGRGARAGAARSLHGIPSARAQADSRRRAAAPLLPDHPASPLQATKKRHLSRRAGLRARHIASSVERLGR
eukprot:7552599-Alexandrium_andersonii.AAC.1